MKVLIQSFSYRRTGYPVDKTGKGGGFVFDCRAIDAYDYSSGDNPGTPFKHMDLTGLDPEISNVLDEDMETQKFLIAVLSLVELDLGKCLRLSFNIMTINFGCTAGQHRSVYMAELFAQYIRTSYPSVEVELNHLEKDHWPKKLA